MGSSYTISHQITLEVCVCPVKGCGVTYGLDEAYKDRLRAKAAGFYCPNGHWLSWPESDADKQRKRAEKAEKDAKFWRDRMRDEQEAAQHARNQARAEKAAKTRLKNRIAKGICPCCKRHFANVHRHITSQHPEFVLSEASGDAKGPDND